VKCKVKGCDKYAGYCAYPKYFIQTPVCKNHLSIELDCASENQLLSKLKDEIYKCEDGGWANSFLDKFNSL